MNLPLTPPTDSLWKFIAISGLILILVGAILPVTVMDRLFDAAMQLDQDNRIEIVKIQETKDAQSHMHEDLNDWKSLIAALPTTRADNAAEINKLRQDLETNIQTVEKQMIPDLEERDVKTNVDSDRIRMLDHQATLSLRNSIWLGILGAILWLYGSTKWQNEIQKPQDELLKLQVAKARAELQPKAKTPSPPKTNDPEDEF